MVVETKQAAEQKSARSERDETKKSSGSSTGIQFETVEHKVEDLIPTGKGEVA